MALAVLGGVLAQEVPGQERDVRRARAQRRHLDGDDVEPVVEVLAELAVARPSARRSRLVAAMTRTSTWIVSLPPTRSNSRSCRKRSSLTWTAGEISPISSRNSVPPSACWKRPSRRPTAPVKAPRSWPNSSLSSSDSASAAQCSLTNGPLARGLRSWMAAAISSLPVPDSPVMSTLARDAAIWATVLKTSCIGRRVPMMFWKLYSLGQARAQAAGLGAEPAALQLARDHQRTARRR